VKARILSYIWRQDGNELVYMHIPHSLNLLPSFHSIKCTSHCNTEKVCVS